MPVEVTTEVAAPLPLPSGSVLHTPSPLKTETRANGSDHDHL
jgi:hypothetical protein